MSSQITAFFLTASLALGADAFAQNWPQFRGPDGNATSTDAQLPLNWNASTNIIWKTELPGRGASSPIVWDDRIYLTAFSGYGVDDAEVQDKTKLQLHVLCINREDGAVIWDQSTPGSPHTQDVTNRVQDHGYATGTPATDGKAVFAYFGVSGLIAYSTEGELLWQAETGIKTAGFGSASSPVLHGDLVIVNASIEGDQVIAFNKQTGEKAWAIDEVKRSWTTPCLAKTAEGAVELVVNQIDVIRGFDPTTGKELWSCAGIDDYVVPAPVSHEGVVYCLGGRQNRCIAVRLGGRGDVTDTHKLWEVNIGANVTSPVYYQGHLYWASDKGIATCLDAKTGEPIYRERLDTRARIYSSIVRGADRLYVTTRDEGVTVLPAAPEYKELAVNTITTDETLVNSSPAISGDRLFLRTDKYLYSIGNK
ncbi:outer membrane protein assembly factor BamB family protein [Lignipirellula cremea]|uniref:Outer membrane biogenesis protein BamB n=1 Tax=Lignipirellula cremea TaxID=2528010 RepID=A0A518DL78_9BACT|nr:PQQ-binding-like beta-propeller repeat protein [Lignipirellula cremea]QDU92592.1 outer membrane biogenesis protein BamB [Lignipirellula cremea]